MSDEEAVLASVRGAIRSIPRLGTAHLGISLALAEGDVTIEGEVADVASKKLVLEAAAAVPAVTGIVHRLRVRPAAPMGDREILDHVRDALLGETALSNCAVLVRDKGTTTAARLPESTEERIEISVAEGVVTLDGEVPGLARKRLAGVLAWWVPGSRDVINRLEVVPPEEDSDEAIADAVAIVPEKDPFVDAHRCGLACGRRS